MQSEWSACPPDVLQHCLDAQKDYNDNAAAACVNKLWRDTFRSGGLAIDMTYCALRPLPTASYLHQFSQLMSVSLRCPPVRQSRKSWLANSASEAQQCVAMPAWTDTLSQVPPTCAKLTLDLYLPGSYAAIPRTLTQSLSQLTNLQQLTLHHGGVVNVSIASLSGLTNLESLQISGNLPDDTVLVVGSLQALPSSITRLQLSGFQDASSRRALSLEDLTHLQHLKDLDLTQSIAYFHGMACKSGLSMLTRLILSDTVISGSLHDVMFLTALQVLTLRAEDPKVFGGQGTVCLSDLLCQLSCLQQLDVIGFSPLTISAADCRCLKLSSFSFDCDQLDNPDQSCFEHYASAQVSKPFLRMDGNLATSDFRCWLFQLPFCGFTYLTMHEAWQWPPVFKFMPESRVQHLRVLDIRFSAVSDGSVVTACLGKWCRLEKLYIAGSRFQSYDFAECTTLVSLNIIHTASFKPFLTLPPFLTRLCLYNMLSASRDLGLHTLDDLISVKLGGRAAGKAVTRELPKLPSSTVELDLWDGLLIELEHLTRLTNLKKLTMPDPPTEQELHIIRQLRQLRWLDVTDRVGMYSRDCSIIPPWVDQ